MAERDGSRFGIEHLIAWLSHGDAAALAVAPQGAAAGEVRGQPFSTVTMSSLPQGSPPMEPGGLFVAIRGEQRDGHEFVADAFHHGAVAALVSHVPQSMHAAAVAGRLAVLDFRSGALTSPRPSATPLPQERGFEATPFRVSFPFSSRERGPGGEVSPTGPDPGEGRGEVRPPTTPLLLLVDDPMSALQRCAAWWRRQMPARVIGITGSVGKTTAKDLLANVLGRRFRVLRTEGNLNNELGLPFMLLKLTPAHERAVLEIGISDVGEMETFAAIAGSDVAVVTRVAPAHMHRFKDVDTIEREKGRLVEALGHGGVAVLNADDPRVARMAGHAPGRVVLFGESEAADVRATDVEARGADGLDLTIHYQGRGERVHLPLVGRHFVASALAAAACGFVEGCDWDDVRAGLAAELESQRLKPRRLPTGVTLLDDTYNASPEASKAALEVLAALPGRKVAVLGDMFELGDYAEVGHADVGRFVPGRADLLVTVGELGAVIAQSAREAGMPAAGVQAFGGNDAAAAFLGARLRPGDFVLIKGSRGMRMDSIVSALAGEPEAAGGHH